MLDPVTGVRITTSTDIKNSERGAPLTYSFTTNITYPSCDTGFSDYVDLKGFGIFPQSTVIGNDVSFSAFSGQDPFRFYGFDYSVFQIDKQQVQIKILNPLHPATY